MRNRYFSAELGEDEGELVGQIRHYGDPLFLLECLAVIVGEIAKTSGVPPLEVAADLHGLIARRQRTEAGGGK